MAIEELDKDDWDLINEITADLGDIDLDGECDNPFDDDTFEDTFDWDD